MQDVDLTTTQEQQLPDEDGSVLVFGFLVIKDADTGEILVSTRA